jgi:hypothetical protein
MVSRKSSYRDNREHYEEVARKARELALTRQSSIVNQQIDSLARPQKQLNEELKEYLVYADDFERRSFFARNASSIREDIEYALAKAQKMAGTRDADKLKAKVRKKQQEIDEEMEKIEEQLKELEEGE